MFGNDGARDTTPTMVVERRAVLLRAAIAAIVPAWLRRFDLGVRRRLTESGDDVVDRKDADHRERDEQRANRPHALPVPGT